MCSTTGTRNSALHSEKIGDRRREVSAASTAQSEPSAFAERWVRSVKQECLSKLILFGEGALQRGLTEDLAHYHSERNQQGKGNLLLFPSKNELRRGSGSTVRRQPTSRGSTELLHACRMNILAVRALWNCHAFRDECPSCYSRRCPDFQGDPTWLVHHPWQKRDETLPVEQVVSSPCGILL